VQYVFLGASGAPNSRAAPGSPHSSYATVNMDIDKRVSIGVMLRIKTIATTIS